MRQSSTAHGSARAEQRYRDRHVCSGCAVIDEDRLAAEQRARVLIDRHYSLPDSCYGGADTLSDARGDYLQARAFALDVQEAQVPSSIEHIRGCRCRPRSGLD